MFLTYLSPFSIVYSINFYCAAKLSNKDPAFVVDGVFTIPTLVPLVGDVAV
jgi:hypothetical protein